MARAFSGVLGSIALCLIIVRGLILGWLPDVILTQALVAFAIFASLGFCIGWMAEQTVCESVENRFRSEIARLHAAAAEKSERVSD